MDRLHSELQREQLDFRLNRIRALHIAAPKRGWIHAIRTTLGMTTRQLAVRVGVAQRVVVGFEQSEERDSISLATLRRVARAMDCELVYALVPRRPLSKTLEQRANELARAELARVAHSMSLEDQAVPPRAMKRQRAAIAREILEERRRDLWD